MGTKRLSFVAFSKCILAVSVLTVLMVFVLRTLTWGLFPFGNRDKYENCVLSYDTLSTCQLVHSGKCSRQIAVVGNGPITEEQRKEINTFDTVIRFNGLNNWLCEDRLDIWVLEHSEGMRWGSYGDYKGPAQLELCRTEVAVHDIRGVWLLGGNQSTAGGLLSTLPLLAAKPSVLVALDSWAELYNKVVAPGSPSSGWVGLMVALTCRPLGGEVHAFGFNWARGHHWEHQLYAELAVIDWMDAQGQLILHPTPCASLSHCQGCYIVREHDNGAISCTEDRVAIDGDVPRAPKQPAGGNNLMLPAGMMGSELRFLLPEGDGGRQRRRGRGRVRRRPRVRRNHPVQADNSSNTPMNTRATLDAILKGSSNGGALEVVSG